MYIAARLVCAGCLLWAGCAGLGTSAVPDHCWPPPVSQGDLEVPADRTRAIADLKRQVEAALASGDVDAVTAAFPGQEQSVGKWSRSVIPDALDPVRFDVKPLYPLGAGVVCELDLFTPRVRQGGYGKYHWGRGVFIAPGADGTWRVHQDAQRELTRAVLTRLVARIEIRPASEWLAADVTATVTTGGSKVLPFRLAVRAPGEQGRLRVTDVTQEGKPCSFLLHASTLVIRPAVHGDEVTLRIRYEGEAAQNQNDFVTAADVVLRHDARWLPTLPRTVADFDVSVECPAGFTLFGQGEQTGPEPAGAGLVRTRWRLPAAKGFTLYGGPDYMTRELTAGGVAVTVALWPRHAKNLEPVADTAERMLERLVDLLGPYPFGQMRVVESGYGDGRSGYGAVTNVTLGWRNLEDAIEPAFFAHEFSHGWFGGLVPGSYASLSRGQWNETLAEYVSSLVQTKEAAARQRAKWSKGYAGLPSRRDRAMLETGTLSANWGVHHRVTYQKGALVMVALEDRVGRERLLEAFRSFLRRRAGKPSGWEDLLDAVAACAGADAEEWLRHWLTTRGAPDLRLADVKRTSHTVSARLVLSPEPAFAGTVEVGFFRGEELLGTRPIPFSRHGGSFELEIPKGADRLVLDPRHRLPRRYDPHADPHASSLEIRLTSSSRD